MERKKRKETSNKKHAFATQAKTSEGEKEERGRRMEDGAKANSKGRKNFSWPLAARHKNKVTIELMDHTTFRQLD